MAKDGTNRGGQRTGAGRKPKPLTDKITEGRSRTASVLSFPETVTFEGTDMPPAKEYMKADQKNGIALCAEEV